MFSEPKNQLKGESAIRSQMRILPGSIEFEGIECSESVVCDLDAVEAVIAATLPLPSSDLSLYGQTADFAQATDAVFTLAYTSRPDARPLLDHIAGCDFCAPAFAALVERRLQDVGITVTSDQPLPSVAENTDEMLLQDMRAAASELGKQGSRKAAQWIEDQLAVIEETMDQAEQMGKDMYVVAFGIALHRYYWWHGLVDQMPRLVQAERAAHRSNWRSDEAYIIWAQADLLRRKSLYQEALERYQRAEQIYLEVHYPVGRADCVKGRADISRRSDEYQPALALYDQAIDLYSTYTDLLGVANCIKGKADTYRRMDQWNVAIALYEEAKWRYEDLGTMIGVANCLKGKAGIYRAKGLFPEALSYCGEAQSIYESIGARIGVAHSLRDAGDIHWMSYQYKEAIDNYRAATEVYASAGLHPAGLARTHFGWAETYRRCGDFMTARRWLLMAFKEYLEIKSRSGYARCLRASADILRKQYPGNATRQAKALLRYTRALKIYRTIGCPSGEADCLRGMATTRRYRHQHDEALALYRKALSRYESIGAGLGSAYCLRGMGKSYLALEQFEDARNAFGNEAELLSQFDGRKTEAAHAKDKQKRAEAQVELQNAKELIHALV